MTHQLREAVSEPAEKILSVANRGPVSPKEHWGFATRLTVRYLLVRPKLQDDNLSGKLSNRGRHTPLARLGPKQDAAMTKGAGRYKHLLSPDHRWLNRSPELKRSRCLALPRRNGLFVRSINIVISAKDHDKFSRYEAALTRQRICGHAAAGSNRVSRPGS